MRLLILTQVVDREDSNLGFFHRWIEEFAKKCDHVIVVCLREGKHALPANVEVLSLGKERQSSRAVRVIRLFRYITSRRQDYDAVFVHMNPEYVVLAGWFWRLFKKRIVLWYTHKSVTLKLRIAALLVHAIATASKESFRLKSSKVHIIGHGIDTSIFHPDQKTTSEDGIRMVTLGRISASKHILEMLTVLDILSDRGRSFTFDIVGEPYTPEDHVYIDSLRNAIARRPFAEKIILRGGVPYESLPALLTTKDIFINLSTTGSVDKAVLDALAAGVPAVTSNEAFKEGSLARYCPLDPKLLADAIEELVNNPPDPVTLASQVTATYGLPQCIGRIISLYQ